MTNPILKQANEVITGPRQADYGHSLDNLGCIAEFWSTFIYKRFKIRINLTAEDASLMMVLLKIDREANLHKDDNLIDGAGYLGLVQEIIEERKRREMASKTDTRSAHPDVQLFRD
jgi:hypothetical protein